MTETQPPGNMRHLSNRNRDKTKRALVPSESWTANATTMRRTTRKNRLVNKTMKILAIKPGSRYLGVAVLEGPELLYWKIKAITKEKGADEKKVSRSRRLKRAEQIVESLIKTHQPRVLAVEQPFYASSIKSSFLSDLNGRIEALGRVKKLKVASYLPIQTRKFLCDGNGRVTKMEVERIIATNHFPWLFRYYQKDLSKHWWEEKYYYRMFDAVALALYCRRVLAGKTRTTSRAA
jgi:Holliday junction resolvasome RuvABC endonuclease subunit